MPQPEIEFPTEFLTGGATTMPRTPGTEVTGNPRRAPPSTRCPCRF
jgi:hypothetical protein